MSSEATANANVSAAARSTLGARSARVWRRRYGDPAGPPRTDFSQTEEGVADLARRRTELEIIARGPGVEALLTRFVERHPWLEGDPLPPDEGPARAIFAGTARFYRDGSTEWSTTHRGDPDAPRRVPDDPLWVVEALQVVWRADLRGRDETVRDAPCRRYGFAIDVLEAYGAQTSAELRGRGSVVAGEVWIDDHERIRRVSSTLHLPGRRRRGDQPRFWETTELWDFGVDVQIELPTVGADEGPSMKGLAKIAWGLWKRKRAYERDHSR